jgi:hypothetical protein
LQGFKTIATTIVKDEELSEAHDLVRQTVRTLDAGSDDLIRTVQLVGESIHADELREDLAYWRACDAEAGRGYKDRINGHNRRWFEEEHRGVRLLLLRRRNWLRVRQRSDRCCRDGQ